MVLPQSAGRIAVFDSGIGGLNILSELKRRYPKERFIYLADEKFMPYGTKPLSFLEERVAEILRLFGNARATVIACNTASSVYSHLGLNIPSVFEIIEATCESAVSASASKRIGVIATDMTISLGMYQKRLCALGAFPLAVPCSELVELTESKAMLTDVKYRSAIDDLLKGKLAPFRAYGIDTLICGCTHFGYLKEELKRHLGDINYIVSDTAAADYTERRIVFCESKFPAFDVFTTGSPDDFERKMHLFGFDYKAQKIEL